MRTAKFTKDVLHPICHLLDLDPIPDLQGPAGAKIISATNTRAKEAWDDLKNEQNTVTEERAFRQVYFDSVAYPTGSELYWPQDGLYYRALVDTTPGDLPSDGTKFELITELDKYIELQQFAKQTIAEVIGVWTSNPRTNSNARKVDFEPGPYGVDIARSAGPTVWIEFLATPSEFSATVYDAGVTYPADEVVYNPADGESYLSLIDNNLGVPLSDTTKWLWQPMPYDIAGYVKYAAASDCTDDTQDKATWRADAESSLGAAFNRQDEQGKRTTYSLTGKGPMRSRELAGYCESRNLIGDLPWLL